LLHYAISRERKPDLTSEQMELIDRCNALVTELRGEDGRVYREERISVMGSNFEEITFGTCDVLMVKSDRVILIDWKFGRKEVGEAANNLQLAAYAVGAAQIHGVDTVECHVFQPRINHHSTYAFTDIPAVLSSIEELIEISNAPVWTFNPSEKTCQYCRAKFVCKPCLSALQQLPAIAQGTDLALAAAMPDLIARAKQAAKIADAVLDKAKAMLTEGHEIPGYFLKPGNEVRKVTDIAKAFELIKDFISYEDYLKLCTVPPAKLEEVFIQAMKAASPEMSKKDAEAKFSELMRPVICKSQNAPSLAVDKKRGKNEK